MEFLRYNEVMFIVGILKWWYTTGWRLRAEMILDRLDGTRDFFSIGLLLRTMFSLFRQDGAGSVEGTLSVKLNAFAGRLISRFIGAGIRFTVLILGVVTITLQALLGGLALAVWAAIPLMPIVGFVLMGTGWVPWQF